MSYQAVNIMDGFNGAGVSVPDTRECVSDPFQRDHVLYFGCSPSGQHGAMYTFAGSGFSIHSEVIVPRMVIVPARPTLMQVALVPDPPLPSSQMILARFL